MINTEQNKRDILKAKLATKIKQLKNKRLSKQHKKDIIDDNLKDLGINNMNDLSNYLESIKDIDKTLIIEHLQKMDIDKTQVDIFLKNMKKLKK